MITHRNIAWTVESLARCIRFDTFAGKQLVSYLPMAHIAERMTSHYQMAFLGYEVTCCPDPAQAAAYLREVRPNLVFGVPRVWEKMHAGVHGDGGRSRAAQFDAGSSGRPASRRRLGPRHREQEPWQFLDDVALSGLVGLDQCELAITGAAPIPADVLRWYRGVGIPLAEIYGMSESCGPMTFAAWRGPAGHGRAGHPRLRGPPGRRRRDHLPGRQRVRRLPERPRQDGRGARRRRVAPHAVTSARSTRTATSASSTARRS